MSRLGSLLTAAGLAGLFSGLLFTLVQQVSVMPPLLQAESVETASEHPPVAHPEPAHVHGHSLDVRRTLLTGAANIAIALGFALILGASMTLARKDGWRLGFAWALAGYSVFFVLPSLHLPPELPGTDSGPLRPRQLIWALTVASSAAGLWIAVFSHRKLARWIGVALLVAPLLLGITGSAAPPGLPSEVVETFMRATYLANAVLWLCLGVSMGFLHRRMLRAESHRPPART